MQKLLRPALVVVAIAGSPALAGPNTFFTQESPFTAFVAQQGKALKSIETFEESTAGPGVKIPFPNPLQNGVPRPTFPNGIDATNLIIQTNITLGASPQGLNPSPDPEALWVNGAGFIGSNSIKVGNDEFLYNRFASLDLIFTSHDKTGIGLEVSTFTGFNMGHAGYIFTVYDQFNNITGIFNMPGATATEPSKTFFGVWSPIPIGRVNVWGIFSQPQPFAVDDIQMWVIPSPGAAMLLGLGGLMAARRRR